MIKFKMVGKIVKKYWLFFVLGTFLIIITFVGFLSKSGSKTTTEENNLSGLSMLEKPLGVGQKKTLDLTTKQKGVQAIFDQSIEKLEQPFSIPQTIKLPPGDYTLQAFKEGFKTKVINLTIDNKKREEVYVELSPSFVNLAFYRMLSEKNVRNAGWKQTQLLYHVRNELKEVRKNSTFSILPENSLLQFTPSGNILVSSKNNLYLINEYPKPTPINIISSLAVLSPSGEKLAFLNNMSELEIIKVLGQQTIAKFIIPEGNIEKINWSLKEEILAVAVSLKNTNHIYLANITDNHLEKISSIDGPIANLVISPEEKYLSFTKNSQVIINDLKDGNFIEIAPEKGLLDSFIVWRNENELLLIEKIKQYDRIIDKVWFINPLTAKKTFLAISAPMTNRINLEIKPVLSSNKNALTLVENNGPVWILLLSGSLNDFLPEMQLPEKNNYSAP